MMLKGRKGDDTECKDDIVEKKLRIHNPTNKCVTTWQYITTSNTKRCSLSSQI